MPFQKKHKLGALPIGDETLDVSPISFKGRKGQKDKLRGVPNWQERLRDFVDSLIKEADKLGGDG
jgi:hypothetical protein